MNKLRLICALLALAICLLAFVACGDNETAETSDTEGVTDSSASSEQGDSAAESIDGAYYPSGEELPIIWK